MSIENLIEDARRAYAAGVKPVRREFECEEGKCALGAAGFPNDNKETVGEWSSKKYGLTPTETWAFIYGFDGLGTVHKTQESAHWEAGAAFAKEVFGR